MSAEDGVQDLTALSNIDEHGINTNLRVRYKNDKIYTYTGTILVAVNPYKELPIYETDWVFLYNGQGQKMSSQEPHIFAIAEAAYSSLQTDNTNQACVISGESGAGKTESTKFILQYLCTITSSSSTMMEHQILEANTILEAFGNAKTVRNDNSSRFGKFIQVCFDRRCQIKGCIIQDYLLEQSRLNFQSKGERNYHVFYQLVAAAANNHEIRNQFLVEKAENYAYLSQSGCYRIDGVDDNAAFESLRLAMSVLYMPTEMCDGIFSVLSAILWLGNIMFEDYQDGERCKLKAEDEEILATVATLLGLDAVRLTQATLQRQINVRGNITEIPFKVHEARENRHAMAKALYSRTFSWIVNYINTCTAPGKDSQTRFLGVLDIFGFENFATNSFEQLCINYANEKLHRFFNHYVFALEQEMYRQEGINFSHINFTDNTPCLELLEKPPKCIFRLLTEECRVPKGSDTSYVNKLHSEFESHPCYVRGDDRRNWSQQFGIKHYAGQVIYKVDGFLDKSKDVQQDQLFDLMSGSKNVFIKDLVQFQDLIGISTSRIGPGGSTLPRPCSAQNSTTSKGRPTVADAFRLQLTALVDVLHSTNPWYVRCIKPNMKKSADCYDSEQVLTQLQYLGMLDIIRIRREGYPIHFTFEDFVTRYKCVLKRVKLHGDKSKLCVDILKGLSLPEDEWQIGINRVFLKAIVYELLDEQRTLILNQMAVIIQSNWKGYKYSKEYLIMRNSAITIQRYFRGHRQCLAFMRKRRAAVTIQSYVRGMFDREVAAALRQMKRVEADMREKEIEEQERKIFEQKKLKENESNVNHNKQSFPNGINQSNDGDDNNNNNNNRNNNEINKTDLDESLLLAQTEIENITQMMEQSGLLNKNLSNDYSSIGSAISTGTLGSNGSESNYVDLDKMFAFLTELTERDGKASAEEINRQFDKLIENAEAHITELENLKIDKGSDLPPPPPIPPPPPPIPASFNQFEPPPPPPPPPPMSTIPKPTQEVAPTSINGFPLDKSQPVDDQQIYAPLPNGIPLGYPKDPNGYPNMNGVLTRKDQLTQQQSSPFHHQQHQLQSQQSINDINNDLQPNMEERRKQRVDRKLMQLQEEQQLKAIERGRASADMEGNDVENNRAFEMLEFANKYFNSHTRDSTYGSSVMRTLTRRKKVESDYEVLNKGEMLTWNPMNSIPTSHIHMHDPENAILACTLFKEIHKYLSQDLKSESEIKLIQSIVVKGIEREELRDEIFVQLVRQSTNNPSREETLKAWVLLGLTSAAFQPGKIFSKYFYSFLRKYLRKDAAISCYAQFCLDNLHPKNSVQTSRRMPPSSLEINAVKSLSSLVCRFHFLDGRVKAIDLHPCYTAADAMMHLAGKIGLKNLDGWAIYEQTPEYEKVIRSFDYIADILSQWESNQKNSIYGSKYGSIGKGSSLSSRSDYRFVFKKRLIRNTREIPHDPVEVNLLYAQAVHSVVKKDEFPVSERIALQLAGLQAQISLGDFQERQSIDKYEDIDYYLCSRIRKAYPNRSNKEWSAKILESHQRYGKGKPDLIAKVWYLSVVMQYPLYGAALFPVSYKGYLSYGHNLLLGVNSQGILLVNPTEKSIMKAYLYSNIESMSVYQGQDNFITFQLSSKLSETHKFFTFETKQKDEIAALVTSYCPSLSSWLRKGGNFVHNNNNRQIVETKNQINSSNTNHVPTRRLLKMSLEDRMKYHQEVMNSRKVLIDSGILRKSIEGNLGFVRNTLRKLNKVRMDKIKMEFGGEFEAECFKHYPHSFWAYSKSTLQNSILVISDPDLESTSINNFNAILTYSGHSFAQDALSSSNLPSEEENGNQQSNDENEWLRVKEKDHIRLAQSIIDRCTRKDASDIFKNEFFLQLIKQTTDHPDPNSKVNIRHWQLLVLACSITYPTDRRILSYLHAHLRKRSLDEVTEEGKFAQFALKNLQGTLETRGRKITPSRLEILSTIECRRIYARIHFLDGQFQAVEFDACATISEVIEQIQIKIGLRPNCPGYALYQSLGGTSEQALQPEEKVGDAIAFWERWHEDQGKLIPRKTQHFFVFKKHLFLDSYIDLKDPVEKELLFHQVVHNIRHDRFPITEQEAIMLCALKAQLELGDFDDNLADYRQNIPRCLPPRLLLQISPEAVVTQHQTMKGMDAETAKQSFFNLIQSWPLHRATLFEVTQTYTSSWPRSLWLAIDQTGMHLLELKTRNVLTSCDYLHMVDYTPSANSLMIVAMGKKYIFLTQQALQIAQIIRDYTTVIAKERGVGRRKSVEFDLAPKSQKCNPPLPPPRPSLQQRQQIVEQQSLYANHNQNQNNYTTYTSHQQLQQQQQQHQNLLQMHLQAQGSNIVHQHHRPNHPQFHPNPQFQPTHRRSRPLSILYKPPPVIMTEAEQV
ncbi:myosin-I heavy chain-like isoform X2 [Panonychus citri]|uniref:myosin-I heavy chain-like isoform X2 n=1 Tax=Panonychus citri TaxID=50023 RepID=UPI0023079F9A|nr:myosin-I heavy chain-like isoform X2 [Panonychus citri]